MKKTISFFIVALIINSSLLIDNCICQWVQTNGPFGGNVLSLAVNGNNIFAGTDDNGVYFSTNNSANWTQTALNNQFVYSLARK
ncbi:MAG: hypothetical protein NTV87_17335 [Ignavibacteriae bacterium]|nr:hypothetical protein [Ignavibacteriota bacterium]